MKLHPILLVLPWTLVIAELDYAAKKRTKRRAERLREERLREERQRKEREHAFSTAGR